MEVRSSSRVAERPADWVWWRDGVVYQIYPRSFADSNGDGIGDLRGIAERLDYLAWLGVDCIWLNPPYPSADEDWGFDVSDYCDVHPELGTLADLDHLIERARERGIRVVLDIVPNHTSESHPWFRQSRADRANGFRDFYVWGDPKPDSSMPNNWVSLFGGPAWTLDPASEQFYLHNFLPEMPDLNWWSPAVREAFDDILRFWFERGIAGFRIDIAHGIVKDRELRDNPPAEPGDPPEWRRMGQRPMRSCNRPEAHDVHKHWRRLCDSYKEPRVLIGETWVYELERLASFYGNGEDELHLPMNFVFLLSRFDPARLAGIVARIEELLPPGAQPTWAMSNHDLSRFPSRWARGDRGLARCLLMLLLTLRGTPFLYYGDELGMIDTDVTEEQAKDRVALRFPQYPRRDKARTPMPWSAEPGAGFTAPGVRPWLPFGNLEAANVGAQREDPGSSLRLCRDLIDLRRHLKDLRRGAYERLEAPEGVWAFRRGERTIVALNLADAPARLAGVAGEVVLATERARDGEVLNGTLDLPASHGVVMDAEPANG